jgi:DNA-directed RNA polymerase specialized sigma24 family protein
MSAASLIAAQQEFTVHLPALEKAARWAFGRGRRLKRQDYEEVLAEVCAAAWSAWVGLLRRGKDPVQVGVHGIANNAVRYVRNGRRVANRSGGRGAMDIYHPAAQKDRGYQVINPDSLDETVNGSPPGVWTNSCTPADEACFRVDYEQWLGTLSPRRRRIAELLTEGHGTLEVAREIGVTSAAISQTRAWLHVSWRTFQGDMSATSG